jgi:hypothetical protein
MGMLRWVERGRRLLGAGMELFRRQTRVDE